MNNAKPSDHVIERAQLWVCANCSEPEIENALLEALAILRQNSESGWQPIETAPSNETVLGVVDGETRLIRWGKASHVPIYGWCLADQGTEDFDVRHPTLWQPKPLPPKVKPIIGDKK